MTSVSTSPRLPAMLPRLHAASVQHSFDAYADIDWDSPELRLDPDDPRLQLPVYDPLSRSEWYRTLPAGVRSRLGLARLAAAMTVGWEFENWLQRGLLDYSYRHSADAAVFRYLQHEIAEEAQHTLMFREFAHRAGVEGLGLRPLHRELARYLAIPSNRVFPPLFFLFVLGGEDPADHLQRRLLAEVDVHPLVARIMHIHVTEESRHLSFARQYLLDTVPGLRAPERAALAALAAPLYGVMARLMVYPHPAVVQQFEIPTTVLRAAYGGPQGTALLGASVAKPRALCRRLGLLPRWAEPAWRAQRIAG